jgi:hypothetical protein
MSPNAGFRGQGHPRLKILKMRIMMAQRLHRRLLQILRTTLFEQQALLQQQAGLPPRGRGGPRPARMMMGAGNLGMMRPRQPGGPGGEIKGRPGGGMGMMGGQGRGAQRQAGRPGAAQQ